MLNQAGATPQQRSSSIVVKPSRYPDVDEFFEAVEHDKSDLSRIKGLVGQLKKDKLQETFIQMRMEQEAARRESEMGARGSALLNRMQDRLTNLHHMGYRKRQSEYDALASEFQVPAPAERNGPFESPVDTSRMSEQYLITFHRRKQKEKKLESPERRVFID